MDKKKDRELNWLHTSLTVSAVFAKIDFSHTSSVHVNHYSTDHQKYIYKVLIQETVDSLYTYNSSQNQKIRILLLLNTIPEAFLSTISLPVSLKSLDR